MSTIVDMLDGDAQWLRTRLRGSGHPVRMRMPRGFLARFREARRGNVRLGRVVAGEHESYSSSRYLGAEGLLVFTLLRQGYARFTQDGRTARLDPGDFCVYAADRPYELHFDTEYEIVGLLMPTGQLTGFGRHISGLTATKIEGADATVAALGSMIDGLERGVHEAAPAIQARLLDHASDMMETLSRVAVAVSGAVPTDRARLLNDALLLIDDNLSDPGLTPATIARVLFVSVRTLYSVFEDAGMSVSATIRARRLARCCRDLADPALAGEPVAAIGARWGFTSPSYFSTAFHGSTGMSPREYRQRYATL